VPGVDLQVLDELQADNIAIEVGVADGAQDFEDAGLGYMAKTIVPGTGDQGFGIRPDDEARRSPFRGVGGGIRDS
jgi:hypothetical protein